MKGVTVTPLPGCAAGGSCAITNLPSGIYSTTGDLTITSYSQSPGAHVTILSAGDINIAAPIKVPAGAGNLLILAAKQNINVDATVGEANPASANTDIEAVMTAEGSIILKGDGCADGVTPDKKLNIAGNLVANSIKPFAIGGAGVVNNERSLCSQDAQYAAYSVNARPDFVTQLTDFYKVPFARWREVAP